VPSFGPKKGPGDHVAAAGNRATLFRQNVAAEFDRLRWARSATKHRISKSRVRHVLESCLAILEEDPSPGDPMATDPRLVFLGEDSSGNPLEVIAVESDRELLTVIHAMELRPRYRSTYEKVKKCIR
jgi:hypothetical protein